jgi:ATP-dependent Lhr-like helicase
MRWGTGCACRRSTRRALTGLKFSKALPRDLAVATLATRLADLDHARAVRMEPACFER